MPGRCWRLTQSLTSRSHVRPGGLYTYMYMYHMYHRSHVREFGYPRVKRRMCGERRMDRTGTCRYMSLTYIHNGYVPGRAHVLTGSLQLQQGSLTIGRCCTVALISCIVALQARYAAQLSASISNSVRSGLTIFLQRADELEREEPLV